MHVSLIDKIQLRVPFFTSASVLAVIVVVTSLAPEEKPFGIFTFPPVTCIDLTSTFSSMTLPQSIFAFIGISLTEKIAWVIHKVRCFI